MSHNLSLETLVEGLATRVVLSTSRHVTLVAASERKVWPLIEVLRTMSYQGFHIEEREGDWYVSASLK